MKTDFWKKVFVRCCIYFFAASLFIVLFSVLFQDSTVDNIYKSEFSVIRLLFVLVFCFIFAFANRFHAADIGPRWLRLLVHFAVTVGGFLLCLYTPMVMYNKAYDPDYKSGSFLIIMCVSAVVYFVAYGIYCLVYSVFNKKKLKKSDYKPVYKNKK